MGPDLQTTSYPDLAHERLRQELLDHLEQLADSFLLSQTAADFAQTMLGAVVPLQQAVTDLTGRVSTLESEVADLQSRVTALENPTPAA